MGRLAGVTQSAGCRGSEGRGNPVGAPPLSLFALVLLHILCASIGSPRPGWPANGGAARGEGPETEGKEVTRAGRFPSLLLRARGAAGLFVRRCVGRGTRGSEKVSLAPEKGTKRAAGRGAFVWPASK